jgi:hypothetical protein
MPMIGTKGANLDLLVRQGSTFGPNEITIKDSQGVSKDITGAVIRGQVRKTPSAGVSATIVSTVTSAIQGKFVWSIPATQTTLLVADANSETAAASQYVWDMEIEYPDGTIYPLLYGNVNVFREVSKETP